MKRLITLTLAALIAAPLFAQPDKPEHLRQKKEKVDAMKAAFITQELDLTPEEAQTFWPVFNEMDKKIEAYRLKEAEQRMKMLEEGKTLDDLSDDEVKKMMEKRFDDEAAILEIKQAYHDRYLKILGVKRTAKLYMAERKFQRELMRKMRKPPQGKREHQHKE